MTFFPDEKIAGEQNIYLFLHIILLPDEADMAAKFAKDRSYLK